MTNTEPSQAPGGRFLLATAGAQTSRVAAVVDARAMRPRPCNSTRARTTCTASNPRMIRATAASSRSAPRCLAIHRAGGRAPRRLAAQDAKRALNGARGRRKPVECRSSHNFPESGALDCKPLQLADVRVSCSQLACDESRFAGVAG